GGRDDKPPSLHRARQALAQRRVVIDDEQAALGFRQTPQWRRLGLGGRAPQGSVARVHAVCLSFPRRTPSEPISDAAASGRASASKLARFHEMTTCAPPSTRLSKIRSAPLR